MQQLQDRATSDQRTSVRLAGDWLTPGWFALILGALIAASFHQVLFGLQTFVVRDYGFFAYPLAHFQQQCFWRGELPFWDPYNNCGVPFLAQWNTMPLYPPALVYLLLPLNWSLSFFCLLHLFWAGLGMYFLAQRWTGNRLAASVAGVVFAFNGLSLNLLMWPSHIATLSWMPWLVLTAEEGWLHGGRKLVLAAIVGTMQMLAGGPETILLTWVLLGGIWLKELLKQWRARNGNAGTFQTGILWRFPLIILLVAGLAAAQLLPFLDLAAHSQREQGYADTRWSMPGWGWANFFVPMVFGEVWSMGVFFQHGQAWTSSYYLGVGMLLLAIVALAAVRHWRVWFLAAAATVAILLALGEQSVVYRCLRHIVPQLSLMTYPVKFLLIVTFCIPLLAAFATGQWQSLQAEQKPRHLRRLFWFAGTIVVVIAAVLVWARFSPFPGDNYPRTLINGIIRVGFLIGITIIVALTINLGAFEAEGPETLRARGGAWARVRPFLPALLLLLFWSDVWTHEPNQNPTVPSFIYTPGLARMKLAMNPQPELGQSRAMLTPSAALKFREFVMSSARDNFLVKRLGYFADCNLLDDVPKVDGFFSLYPRECGELNSYVYSSTNANFPGLADFMGVSQLTAPGEFFKWMPRTNFLPLITTGQRPVFFDESELPRAVLATNFDAREVVCLPRGARSLVTVTNRTQAQVVSTRFGTQSVEATVNATSPSLVVVAQTYYHRWRASVDGQPTPLLRANYAFQALEVPAGQHLVRLAYADGLFYLGVIISGVGMVICLAVWIAVGRGRPSISRAEIPERPNS